MYLFLGCTFDEDSTGMPGCCTESKQSSDEVPAWESSPCGRLQGFGSDLASWRPLQQMRLQRHWIWCPGRKSSVQGRFAHILGVESLASFPALKGNVEAYFGPTTGKATIKECKAARPKLLDFSSLVPPSGKSVMVFMCGSL